MTLKPEQCFFIENSASLQVRGAASCAVGRRFETSLFVVFWPVINLAAIKIAAMSSCNLREGYKKIFLVTSNPVERIFAPGHTTLFYPLFPTPKIGVEIFCSEGVLLLHLTCERHLDLSAISLLCDAALLVIVPFFICLQDPQGRRH